MKWIIPNPILSQSQICKTQSKPDNVDQFWSDQSYLISSDRTRLISSIRNLTSAPWTSSVPKSGRWIWWIVWLMPASVVFKSGEASLFSHGLQESHRFTVQNCACSILPGLPLQSNLVLNTGPPLPLTTRKILSRKIPGFPSGPHIWWLTVVEWLTLL